MKTFTKQEVINLMFDELKATNKALKIAAPLYLTEEDFAFIGTLDLVLSRQEITYKGFTIERESDPWAIKQGFVYRFYIDGEKLRSADSIEGAKEQIDEITANVEI